MTDTTQPPRITGWRGDDEKNELVVETSDGKTHRVPQGILERLPGWRELKMGGPYTLKDDEHGVAIGLAERDTITAGVGQDTKAASDAAFPMVRVAKSTNVESIGHRGDELRVRFIGKGDAPGSLYSYRGISADLYAEMLESPSPGKFLNARIKPIDKGTKIEPAGQ